ncbi:rhamnulose-1-phosphate aldolase [Aliiruegeria sabulilitoris]|uniref:rhamnulose-1-phosphate aldolase n=1 Tax=Aliiruegeria sabulilitoris TaxID=1510458 RepID=UPI00082E875E|nr:rhamnulose-1-phosphate aldolase [Aliiruegeria sabulilitoris]NDR55864.1 rhamnulose-1-phosphate aldolase [Pseudoruegeria sp. M32A2M]
MPEFTHAISFVEEAAPFVQLCWDMGWNEANGGNFSWRLPTDEIEAILRRRFPKARPTDPLPLDQAQPSLDGDYFLMTGSGQFFRHALAHPDEVFGIIQIVDGGTAYRTVWGFAMGGRPTSEFATHLVGHAIRKEVSGGRERVILHCHVPEFIALSFLMPLDSRELSMALWQKMPECIVIFPDGVRVVPPLLPGTVSIAEASAVELRNSRIISWSHHGIFASEESPDKVFALVETIEKASAIQRRVLSAGGPQRGIEPSLLRELCDKFGHMMVSEPAFLDQDGGDGKS